MALRVASQQEQHAEDQRHAADLIALQPILAASFGQTDTALARQQELPKVADCIVAMAAKYIRSDATDAAERVQHAFASMFSAASLPRLASLSPHDREAELRHLAETCIGKDCSWTCHQVWLFLVVVANCQDVMLRLVVGTTLSSSSNSSSCHSSHADMMSCKAYSRIQ